MKLKNTPVFIFGLGRFDSDIESTAFNLAKEFAKENDVYFIDNPFTLKDYFALKGTEQYLIRKKFFFWNTNRVIKTEIPRLHIFVPPLVLSLNFLPEGFLYRILLKLNEKLIAYSIKRLLKRKGIKKFIFSSFNFHFPNLGKLINPSLFIYHSVDPLIIDYDIRHGIKSEEYILDTCDLVICTSKQLYLEKKKENTNTYFIPNAADILHFSKALTEKEINTNTLAEIKKPIIGYIGNIERRIDYELLKVVADKNPDKSFVLVGPKEKKHIPEWFYQISNIFLTGRASYKELPDILREFDIAIIPFKKDEISNTIFPLKLFEYLGAGKPVISTHFNTDLEEFTKLSVVFCEDAISFSDTITHILKNDTIEDLDYRIKIAAENTWNKRFEQLEILIINNLKS